MILKSFQVRMFKNVLDSGEIEVTPVTVLVGKNESGKTSLLRALHKFRPFTNDPYVMEREWPRGHRAERDPKQDVCTCKFDLEQIDTDALSATLGSGYSGKEITISRLYDGSYRMGHAPGVTIGHTPDLVTAVNEKVKELIPTFIYMGDVQIFDGSALLDQVVQRFNQNQATEKDKTLKMMMGLAGLDLSAESARANDHSKTAKELRQFDLSDASATLTKEIEGRWKQRKYEVDFRADGQQFFTFVRDEKDPSLIHLEERSDGFKWFFSFDLLFMHETKGTFKGSVLLLDEPGLHLHPSAQRDLLKRLEAYAKDNTLIYTTHLPFMIDLREPERIRVISETDSGVEVSADLTKSQPDAKLVLQAALGMEGSTSYLIAQRNLVVEGADDFWILTQLSRLNQQFNLPYMPDDVFITASGSAGEATYIATFMIGQRLDVFLLLDSDSAGNEEKRKAIERWKARYQVAKAEVQTLGEAAGVADREFMIEDLFPDDYYMDAVYQVYARPLAALGISKGGLTLVGNDSIAKRAARALAEQGVEFQKPRVNETIRKRLSGMKSADELPKETREYAKNIFEAISCGLS